MKKVINGKRYNTETAQHKAEWDNELPVNDFSYYTEDLYLKKTGEYFLHGKGGAASPYSKSVGNASVESEKIVPLTIEEAQKWVEEKLDADQYEEIFGVIDEGNSVINVLIPESLHNKLREASEERGLSQKDIVVEALERELND